MILSECKKKTRGTSVLLSKSRVLFFLSLCFIRDDLKSVLSFLHVCAKCSLFSYVLLIMFLYCVLVFCVLSRVRAISKTSIIQDLNSQFFPLLSDFIFLWKMNKKKNQISNSVLFVHVSRFGPFQIYISCSTRSCWKKQTHISE